MTRIKRLLIANRGEIACRIMRSAQARGIHCIAVYSDADAQAIHVQQADEAVHIGGSAAADSYLVIDKVIAAAKSTRSDAIHPGYGFLSERAAFASACAEAGIIFVGPSAEAIELMGDKALAKRTMIEAGVPCVPGYQGEVQDDATLVSEGEKVGFPLMVKAAAGGGGKGMRLVEGAEELPRAIATARSEAEAAFGSGELILERAIVRPRHVEIQVFGDTHGHVIHLGERDCSVQRRHQKVVEEAPCPVMTPELRTSMGEAAIKAAQSVNYVGAGTVEFLLGEDGAFYFLEMNTRLQVEHPVTEQVTGLDLVALQLRVAEGAPLGIAQEDVSITGHSIEVRYYAEDPANAFMPGAGPVVLWSAPHGEGVRVDAGIATGGEVSAFYDPMVAKVIATGADREDARRKLVGALQQSALIGPANNRDFLIDLLENERFAAGSATTAFIDEEFGEEGWSQLACARDYALGAVLLHASEQRAASQAAISLPDELFGWSSEGTLTSFYSFAARGDDGDDLELQVLLRSRPDGSLVAEAGGHTHGFSIVEFAPPHAVLLTPSGKQRVSFAIDEASVAFVAPSGQHTLPRCQPGGGGADEGGSGRITAPMHGKLVALLVEEGGVVESGQPVAMMEAMKMQQEIASPVSGAVTSIAAETGAQLAVGDLLLEIEPIQEDEG